MYEHNWGIGSFCYSLMSLLRANWAKQSTLRYDKKRLDLYKVKFLFSFVFPCPRCNVNLRFNHALPNTSWILIYANQSLINRSLTVSKLCYVTLKNLLFTQKIDDFVLRVGKVYQCRLVEIWNLSSRQEHCLLWLIAMEIFFVKAGRTSWIVCYNCSRQRCCPNLWWRYLQHLLWNLPTSCYFLSIFILVVYNSGTKKPSECAIEHMLWLFCRFRLRTSWRPVGE